MFRDCCVALLRGAMSLSAVCDWYFLIILTYFFPIITTYNYKAVHFINTLTRKGKRFVIGHLTVCMLVYSAVPEKSYRKS